MSTENCIEKHYVYLGREKGADGYCSLSYIDHMDPKPSKQVNKTTTKPTTAHKYITSKASVILLLM